MDLEPSEARETYGPLQAEQALTDVPIFGPQKVNVKALVEGSLTSGTLDHRSLAEEGIHASLLFEDASSVADQLKALRLTAKQGKEQPDEMLLSQLERHERLLTDPRDMANLSGKERFVLDNTMLLRAQEGYRFDFVKNQKIVADDPWLADVWVWVAGE